MKSHSLTPWRVTPDGYLASDNGGYVTLRTPFRPDAFLDSEETLRANAELIVRAVNSHNALTSALEALLEFSDNGVAIQPGAIQFDDARQAIAAANGATK